MEGVMEFEGVIGKRSSELSEESSHQNTPILMRQKTSLRMKYEAESTVIKKNIGSIEDVRIKLGLSQRKMCQLLMVDPSAWSRWQKEDSKVPPHIYRALQWYLALIDKSPEWHPLNTYLGAFRPPTKKSDVKIEELEGDIDNIQRQLKTTLQHNQLFLDEIRKEAQIHWGWKFLMLLNVFAILLTWVF